MKVGDTIAQQVYIPPTKIFSQKIIFGVRINEIIEQLEHKIVFKVQTYSTPGNFLTKLIGPIFSVPYQTFCTKEALKNVKRQLEKQ